MDKDAVDLAADAAQEIAAQSDPVDWDQLARDFSASVRKLMAMQEMVLDVLLNGREDWALDD